MWQNRSIDPYRKDLAQRFFPVIRGSFTKNVIGTAVPSETERMEVPIIYPTQKHSIALLCRAV